MMFARTYNDMLARLRGRWHDMQEQNQPDVRLLNTQRCRQVHRQLQYPRQAARRLSSTAGTCCRGPTSNVPSVSAAMGAVPWVNALARHMAPGSARVHGLSAVPGQGDDQSCQRCALCIHWQGDRSAEPGQLAHIDQDRTNNTEDDLALLCQLYHDGYDTTPSQTKA
jgi:hypothetical protein